MDIKEKLKKIQTIVDSMSVALEEALGAEDSAEHAEENQVLEQMEMEALMILDLLKES